MSQSLTPSSVPRAVSSGAGQLELTAERESVVMLAGTSQHLGLTLRNNAGAPLAVELLSKGLPDQWVMLSPALVTLGPNGTATSSLTLSPTGDAPAGDYPFTLVAQGREDRTIAARLNLILDISAPGELSLALSATEIEGQVEASLEVRVAQSGTMPMRVSLSASGAESACEYRFDPPGLLVAAGETATSRLVVRARQGLLGSDAQTHFFTITAKAVEGGTGTALAEGRFVQRQPPPLGLALSPTEQHGADQAVYTLRVTNASQVEASVRLTASDPDNACQFQFSPSSLRVPPGGTAQGTLTVIPREYQQDAAEQRHTFVVLAEPDVALLKPVQVEGRFVQTALRPPSLVLSPSSQATSGTARFALQVTNPRATPLTLALQPQEGEQDCELTITPASLQLPAGATATVQVSARSTARLLPGEARRASAFTIVAHARDLAEPVSVQGSLILVRASRLLLWLFVAAFLLLVALLFLYLTQTWPFASSPAPLASAGEPWSPTQAAPTPRLPTNTPVPPPQESPLPPPPAEAPGVNPQADGPIPWLDALKAPEKMAAPGEPFDLEIWVSNKGSDATTGGSITLSSPEGHQLAIVDADVSVVPEVVNCSPPSSHAWVLKPDGPCHRALKNGTACKEQVDLICPVAELWDKPWPSGQQHHLRVHVVPQPGAQRVVLFLRVAMMADATRCDLRILPDDKSGQETDQQGFPVFAILVTAS